MPAIKGKVVYINYVDQIDLARVRNLMAIITAIIGKENPETLYFLFSSQGGEVDAGISLYNFLKSLPLKIVMHNIGSIDSIANVIFVAGQKRCGVPHSTYLFHGVQWNITSPTVLTLPSVNEIRARINENHATIAKIICENSKMKEESIKELFAEGDTKNAEFALENGIIHEIKPAQIPDGALLVSVNING